MDLNIILIVLTYKNKPKMKNIFATAMLLSSLAGLCQPYGQEFIPNNSVMTYGNRTEIVYPGFIMAGMNGTDIHIDKTTVGGAIPTAFGPMSWQHEYPLTENGVSCLFSSGYVSTCVGVTVIDLNPASLNAYYIIVGNDLWKPDRNCVSRLYYGRYEWYRYPH